MSITCILEIGNNLAYQDGMSWLDFLSDDERAELEGARSAKEDATSAYNSVYRRLKTRCDARMRRARESQRPVQISEAGYDGESE